MTTALHAPEINSERLRMRPPRADDAPAIARHASDFAVASMTTRMPYPYALADAHSFVALCGQLNTAEQITFVVEHKDAGVIGCLGFHKNGPAPLEMGYWLGRTHWGKGLATEAARAAVDWAHRDWGRRMVASGHFHDNHASGSVLIKAGFLYTGEVQKRFSRARSAQAPTRMMVWLA